MKNYKGFGSIDFDDYSNKLRQLQVSYFMQCIDLTNVFNEQEVLDEETRDYHRQMVEQFVTHSPNTTFNDYTRFIGFILMKEGQLTEKEYKDTLNGTEI